MIKDLVVNLALEVARDPAAEFAISIAAAIGSFGSGVSIAVRTAARMSQSSRGEVMGFAGVARTLARSAASGNAATTG